MGKIVSCIYSCIKTINRINVELYYVAVHIVKNISEIQDLMVLYKSEKYR